MGKSNVCIVCGKKLGFFEKLLGDFCSIKCEDEYNSSNNIEYSSDSYTDYEDIVLDVPIIGYYAIPTITQTKILVPEYNIVKPLSYNSINNNYDDYNDYNRGVNRGAFNPSRWDDYNNPFDMGYGGFDDDY